VIRLSEEASRSLLDGRDSGLIEEVVFDACKREMAAEVVLHILTIAAL
jgi:hypothetical protein